MKLSLNETYDSLNPDPKKGATGILELIIKDRNGNIIDHIIEKNIIKIHAKEMLSHRLPYSKVWDPDLDSGAGAWTDSNIDIDEDYSIRYILLGAAFDENNAPVANDPRYYVLDAVTGTYIPIRLGPGAEYDGGLINSVPIEEPTRPLKRIESISFNSTYQPAGSPLMSADVRSIGNVLVVESVITPEQYNGFSDSTGSDFFNITEVALAGGKKFDTVGYCGLTPEQLFLVGNPASASEASISCTANGTTVVSIDPLETNVDFVKVGDQIKIVNNGGTSATHTTLNQLNPFYQVISKTTGGRDIELDRVPTDGSLTNTALTGSIGVFKNTLKIFSHRILSSPARKSSNFEITVRWTLYFN